MEQALAWTLEARDLALGWLTSPAAWSQFGLLVLAFGLSVLLTRRLVPMAQAWLAPAEGQRGLLVLGRRVLGAVLPLAMPLLAFALMAAGEAATRSLFGSGAVIALGKNLSLFIAARIVVRDLIGDGFLRLLGRVVLLPALALNVLGLLDPFVAALNALMIDLGNIEFTAATLLRGLIAGALLFWLGRWSNQRSEDYIKGQDALRPATRELAIKAAQIAIFGVAFLLLLSIMGIDLTAVAVLGGALGVGIGLGLQQIAANFVSGVILLLEGQTTVGDYVQLDDGSAGTIERMTARAAILRTVDGRWIVVPNEDFITSRITNLSDAGKAHRYSASFGVAYETDITRVPAIIEAAVARLPFVLQSPEGPGCELTAFADSAVEFEVQYWVEGIEDVTGKYRSEVLFAVWNALRTEGIEIPYPQRVVHHRGLAAPLA